MIQGKILLGFPGGGGVGRWLYSLLEDHSLQTERMVRNGKFLMLILF
jgi:hypothetical protein